MPSVAGFYLLTDSINRLLHLIKFSFEEHEQSK